LTKQFASSLIINLAAYEINLVIETLSCFVYKVDDTAKLKIIQ